MNFVLASTFLYNALVYQENGQIKEAIELLEHVVKVQAMLPVTYLDRLRSQDALAVIYGDNGKVKEAVELLEHVVKVQATLPETNRSQISWQRDLAIVYWRNCQMKEAVELLNHIIKVQETTLATTDPHRQAAESALEHYLEVLESQAS